MKWIPYLLFLGMGAAFVTKASQRLRTGALKSTSEPISLIVSLTIKEDRLDDFLKVIEEDAVGSRERENGVAFALT